MDESLPFSSYQMPQIAAWFLQSRQKLLWSEAYINRYVKPIAEAVNGIIDGFEFPSARDTIAFPQIGFVAVDSEAQPRRVSACALYVADLRLPPDQRNTLLGRVKDNYQLSVEAGFAEQFFGDDDLLRMVAAPQRAEEIIQGKTLARKFSSIAAKSLNRRRRLSAHLHYQVLNRDSSTCRLCGRKAPEVQIHVDHIAPISLDPNWITSADLEDYQMLCRECNIGKGEPSWLHFL
jgi:hypothetical protein